MSTYLLLTALLTGCTTTTEECAESSLITVYVDEDRDGFGDDTKQELVCEVTARVATVGGDCDDTRAGVNPASIEECDGLDNDCDGTPDDGLRQLPFYADADGDGFGDPEVETEACSRPPGYVENPFDCDDDDELSNPAATEFCDNGKDNDCDGKADDQDEDTDVETMPTWYLDNDGDGYGTPDEFRTQCEQPPIGVANADDCDDSNPNRKPGAGEVCNGIDDDCDGYLDDSDPDIDPASLTRYYYDLDGDGFGDPTVFVDACDPPWFYVENGDDCDDDDPMLGDAPTGMWVLDGDGDGFGPIGATPEGPSCTAPTASHVLEVYATDCDDTSPDNYPGALEVCDTVDNDCDGDIDDADDDVDVTTGSSWFVDTDGDGFGDPDVTVSACSQPPATTTDASDCDDTDIDVNPSATEVCNDGVDDDCDGLADLSDPSLDMSSLITWYFDFDGDGYGDPTLSTVSCARPPGYVDNDLDCDDNDPYGGAFVSWLADADGDGYGAGAPQGPSCTPPAPTGWASELDGVDCDDTDDLTYPGAEEICDDGLDQDCDLVDEVCPVTLSDTCAEAVAEPKYTTGSYTLTGDLTGLADDVSWGANNACTGAPTAGGDAILPVTLQPGEALYAAYRNDLDGSMSLLPGCGASPTPGTCALGADNVATVSGLENLWYQNTSANARDMYLVLDCSSAGCAGFDLDLLIETPSVFVADTCADAELQSPMITGGYSVVGRNSTTFVNDLNNPNTCTGWAADGKESMVPVELLDGETIRVDYTQVVWDASVYLVRDCTNANTCVAGADNTLLTDPETFGYTNNTGGTETLYLVLDCWVNSPNECGDYELSVSIE